MFVSVCQLAQPNYRVYILGGTIAHPQPLAIGSHIHKPPVWDSMIRLADVVSEIYNRVDLTWSVVDYKYINLTTVEALGVRDVTTTIKEAADGPTIDEELALLKQLGMAQKAKREAGLARTRTPQARGRGRGCGRGRGEPAVGRGRGEPAVEPAAKPPEGYCIQRVMKGRNMRG